MKILLTGPCGRIGFTLLPQLLEAGHEVRCFDTRNAFPSHAHGFNEGVERYFRNCGYQHEWIWGDIRNPEDVSAAITKDIDVVIHHAAMTLPTHCEEEAEYCWDVNYVGSLNVIKAIEQVGNRAKLLFSSSVACYGYPTEKGRVFKESDSLTATCTYAETKIACEQALQKASVNFTIFRIASALDHPAPHLLMATSGEMQERIHKENMLKSPASPGHFVSTHDVNTAFMNSLDNPKSNREVFNVAGPDDCRSTFKAVQDELFVLMGGAPSTDDDWGQGPYPQSYYDIDKSQDALNYVQTSLAGIVGNVSETATEIPAYIRYSSASKRDMFKSFGRLASDKDALRPKNMGSFLFKAARKMFA